MKGQFDKNIQGYYSHNNAKRKGNLISLNHNLPENDSYKDQKNLHSLSDDYNGVPSKYDILANRHTRN